MSDAFEPFRLPGEHQTPEVTLAERAAFRVRARVLSWLHVKLDGAGDDLPDIDPIDLTGGCAIASYVLWRVLQEKGVEAQLVRGSYSKGAHCWVQLQGVCVDATATQFGVPDLVWVTAQGTDPHYHTSYINEEALDDFAYSWRTQSPLHFLSELEAMAREIASTLHFPLPGIT